MIKQNQKNRSNIYYDVDAEKDFCYQSFKYVYVCRYQVHRLELTKFLSFEIIFYLPNR